MLEKSLEEVSLGQTFAKNTLLEFKKLRNNLRLENSTLKEGLIVLTDIMRLQAMAENVTKQILFQQNQFEDMIQFVTKELPRKISELSQNNDPSLMTQISEENWTLMKPFIMTKIKVLK